MPQEPPAPNAEMGQGNAETGEGGQKRTADAGPRQTVGPRQRSRAKQPGNPASGPAPARVCPSPSSAVSGTGQHKR